MIACLARRRGSRVEGTRSVWTSDVSVSCGYQSHIRSRTIEPGMCQATSGKLIRRVSYSREIAMPQCKRTATVLTCPRQKLRDRFDVSRLVRREVLKSEEMALSRSPG